MPNKEHIEQLQKSTKLGFLQPVVRDADTGEILIGRHRKYADKNWPEVTLKCKSELERLLIKLCGNLQRTVSKEETQLLLNRIARQLELQGVEKQRICAAISRLPGMPYTEQWIRELIDPQYKMESMRREIAKPLSQVDEEATQERTEEKEAMTGLEETAPATDLTYPYPNCLCKDCPNRFNCY